MGGPVSFWLGFILMGTVQYAVLVISLPIQYNLHIQITLGEMMSLLPVSGAWYALADLNLSPAIVRNLFPDYSNGVKGYATAWTYLFGYQILVKIVLLRVIDTCSPFRQNSSRQPAQWRFGYQTFPRLCGSSASFLRRYCLTCSMFEGMVKSNFGLPQSRRLPLFWQ